MWNLHGGKDRCICNISVWSWWILWRLFAPHDANQFKMSLLQIAYSELYSSLHNKKSRQYYQEIRNKKRVISLKRLGIAANILIASKWFTDLTKCIVINWIIKFKFHLVLTAQLSFLLKYSWQRYIKPLRLFRVA